MLANIARHRDALIALCRRHGVTRLEVFGSAARGGFDSTRSDVDLLVTFAPDALDDLAGFADFKDAIEALLEHPVDLLDREAIETSRNFIRRRSILEGAETIHG